MTGITSTLIRGAFRLKTLESAPRGLKTFHKIADALRVGLAMSMTGDRVRASG